MELCSPRSYPDVKLRLPVGRRGNETMMVFWGFSAAACVVGAVGLLITIVLGAIVWQGLSPLLMETRSQIQDLGDLAAETTGKAADTVAIVEKRASEMMGEASAGGASVARQAVNVGSVLAAGYALVRVAQLAYQAARARRRKAAGRHGHAR